MSLLEAIRAYLIADAGVAALVGTRVYPVQLPPSVTFPAITYQTISTAIEHHRNISEAGRARVQVDAWAANYGGTIALREAIRAAMATFTKSSDPRIDVTLLQDSRDLLDPDTGRWRASMDFTLWGTV